jgi:hypothetical protein
MTDIPNAHALFHEGLLKLDLTRFDVAVYLASYTKGRRVPQYARILMLEELEQAFREITAFTLERLARDQAGLRLLPHLLDSVPKGNELEFLDLSVAPYTLIGEQVAELERPAVGMSIFREDMTFLQRVRHYTIAFLPKEGGAERPVCFMRQYLPKRKLGRDWLAAVMVEPGYYNRVEPANLVLFDGEVDAIKVGSLLFLLEKGHAYQMFGFREELSALVDEGVHLLCERVTLDNLAAFTDYCKHDSRKAALLHSIVQKPYLASLDMQRISAFIASRGLEIPLDGGRFVCNAASVWSILHLLNDDFLASQLTGKSYEVSGKREQ